MVFCTALNFLFKISILVSTGKRTSPGQRNNEIKLPAVTISAPKCSPIITNSF